MLFSSVIYSQGFLGYNAEDLNKDLQEQEWVGEKVNGVTEGDPKVPFTSLKTEEYEYIVFFNFEGNIYESKLISNNYSQFRSNLDYMNNNYVKQSNTSWISVYVHGVVHINAVKTTYSMFPVFIHSYESH